jgi:hypothetical protein
VPTRGDLTLQPAVGRRLPAGLGVVVGVQVHRGGSGSSHRWGPAPPTGLPPRCPGSPPAGYRRGGWPGPARLPAGGGRSAPNRRLALVPHRLREARWHRRRGTSRCPQGVRTP